MEIKSSSRGLYKHTYNLTWTMKSFVSLEETEISYRRKVRKVGQQSQPWHLSFYHPSLFVIFVGLSKKVSSAATRLREEIFAIQRLDGCIDSYHKRGNV